MLVRMQSADYLEAVVGRFPEASSSNRAATSFFKKYGWPSERLKSFLEFIIVSTRIGCAKYVDHELTSPNPLAGSKSRTPQVNGKSWTLTKRAWSPLTSHSNRFKI